MTVPAPVEPIHASMSAAQGATRPRLTLVADTAAQTANERPVLTAFPNIPFAAWDALHDRAVEPNAYFDPRWANPVAEFARGRSDAQALLAWRDGRLIGLMPVRPASQALSLPLPLLVGWSGYASLSIPLLDRDCAADAAAMLIDAARASGAHALLLPGMAIDGAAFGAFKATLSARGLAFDLLRGYRRAALDASRDGEQLLRDALSTKKLKELRRQRHRLEDTGPLSIDVAASPDQVAAALEQFLALEAGGWKGERGTALLQHPGDVAFIRKAAVALAADGRFEIVSLVRNGATLASGLILRHGPHAYFFKIAMDESEARTSPGVQLTLDLTRHLCSDPRVTLADSSADSEHPMIDHVWRERIAIADVFVPLAPRDPIAAGIRMLLKARYSAIDLVRHVRRMKEKLS